MTYYVLVDCNNFYVSCERLFNPKLENKPVIVLSNNDGCVVARSNEAKKLDIKMGEPFFKIQSFCESSNVFVFSSNYSLYGDLSRRVMNILLSESVEMEIYSIDEAFLKYPNPPSASELFFNCIDLKNKAEKWVGIPLSFGIASTKTLAKIANDVAKKECKRGILNFTCNELIEEVLKTYPISDVWGIGKGFVQRLKLMGIFTAWDFKECNPSMIRKKMGVVGERILWELRGVSCLPLSLNIAKKSISSSRSFGKIVTSQAEIGEALSCFVSKAAASLRAQKSSASAICVYLEFFLDKKNNAKQTISSIKKFLVPTSYTPHIIREAKAVLKKIYVENVEYKKCGIVLLDLVDDKNVALDLFLKRESHNNCHLMSTVDSINFVYGKDKLFFGATGIDRKWKMNKDRSSPYSTTSWECLPQVK